MEKAPSDRGEAGTELLRRRERGERGGRKKLTTARPLQHLPPHKAHRQASRLAGGQETPALLLAVSAVSSTGADYAHGNLGAAPLPTDPQTGEMWANHAHSSRSSRSNGDAPGFSAGWGLTVQLTPPLLPLPLFERTKGKESYQVPL